VEEVLDFSQEDLEEDDVMIVDAWKELFVWVGETARREEKHEAIKTALVRFLRILKSLSLNFPSSLLVISVNLLHP